MKITPINIFIYRSIKSLCDIQKTGMKKCAKSLFFRQRIHSGYLPRDLFTAVFISISIHIFIAVILWNGIARHKSDKPESLQEDRSLSLTLSTFTASSHDIPEPQEIPESLQAEPPDKSSESIREQLTDIQINPETDTGDELTPESESPSARISENDEPQPGVSETASNMMQDFGRAPEFETDTVVRIRSSENNTPEAPPEESSVVIALASLDIENAYDFRILQKLETDRVIRLKGLEELNSGYNKNYFRTDYFAPSFGSDTYFSLQKLLGKIPDSKLRKMRYIINNRIVEDFKIEYKKRYINCKTAYKDGPLQGLFVLPLLIRDAVTGNKCKWIQIID